MELETCCMGLESNKLTERRKSAETLRDIITTPQIINLLNNNDKRMNWNFVYSCLQKHIRKVQYWNKYHCTYIYCEHILRRKEKNCIKMKRNRKD